MELNVRAVRDRISHLEQEDSRYRNGIDHTERAELGTLKALLLAFVVPTVQGFPTKGGPLPIFLDIAGMNRKPKDFGTAQFFAAPKNQAWEPIRYATQGKVKD